MTLDDILTALRAECPDITDRVVTDPLLKIWAKQGDKEITAITRCIVSDYTFNSVTSSSVYTTRYDLTAMIPKFYDIDDFPGGGVSFDDEPLTKTTVSELDSEESGWRTRGAGIPEKYYRRGKYLYFDYPVSTANKEIKVYCSLISDDFTGDSSTPFNGLTYLEPYHVAIVKYLIWRAKLKVGKPNEGASAGKEFSEYIQWMKQQLGGNKFSTIRIKSKGNIYHNNNIGR